MQCIVVAAMTTIIDATTITPRGGIACDDSQIRRKCMRRRTYGMTLAAPKARGAAFANGRGQRFGASSRSR
jgi:hypothetical protein